MPGYGPITFTSDGELLINQDADKIVFYDVNNGAKTNKEISITPELQIIAVSRDGKYLAAADEEVVHVWTLEDRVERHSFKHEGGVSLAFSSDSKRLAAGGQLIKVWNLTDGKELSSFTLTGELRGIVRFSADPDVLISSSPGDNRIKIWDIPNRKELAQLVSINRKDWIVITPDGLFDGSPGAFSQISWRFSKNLFDVAPVEAYFSEFYYPGLLADIFGGSRPLAPSDISQKDRRQIPVEIKTVEKTDPSVPINLRKVEVEVEVQEAPAGLDKFNKTRQLPASGAKDIRLFRNGTLVKRWQGDWGQQDGCIQSQVTPQIPRRTICRASITVVAGRNLLTAYAFNRDNVKSLDAQLIVTGHESLGGPGSTRVLTVGINEYAANPYFQDLTYAEKDSERLSQVLADKQKLLHRDTVITPPIYSEKGTRDEILAALKELARKVNPEDLVVIYFSGHGKATKDGRFYLIPSDVGYQTLPEILKHSISDLDLEDAFREMDAEQILLIIDSCNSGAIGSKEESRRGPMNAKGLAQLAYEKGMYVLAAAQGFQAAVEPTDLKGGLLTYVLLEGGLTAKADTEPTDKQITGREWLAYATQGVPNKQRERIEQAEKKGQTLTYLDLPKGDKPKRGSIQTPRLFQRRERDRRPLAITTLSN
jgi:hypothetical protein